MTRPITLTASLLPLRISSAARAEREPSSAFAMADSLELAIGGTYVQSAGTATAASPGSVRELTGPLEAEWHFNPTAAVDPWLGVASGIKLLAIDDGMTRDAFGFELAQLQAGIDSPLARADVGIAMGTGTDVAMESAHITLVKGDLRGIVRARALSRATMANIKQDLVAAFGYKAAGIPVAAAGVFYPFTGWLLSPMLAALAMSLSSVSVIGNALRLRAQRLAS